MAGSKRRIYEIHKKLVYTVCMNNGENNMGFVFEVIINILEAVLIAQFFVRYFGSKVGKGSVLGKSIYAGAVIGISHFVIVTFFFKSRINDSSTIFIHLSFLFVRKCKPFYKRKIIIFVNLF